MLGAAHPWLSLCETPPGNESPQSQLSSQAPLKVDTTSEIRLHTVHPALAAKLRLVDAEFQRQTASSEGGSDHLEVVQARRSWQQQQQLWLIGRDATGKVTDEKKIVTKAPPGHSWHEFGLAIDDVPRSLLPIPGWNPESPLWPIVRNIGESLGLVSGACFHRQDLPHWQLTGRFGLSPDDEVRALFAKGGVEAVWDAAGITA
jgi:hypothetical protein